MRSFLLLLITLTALSGQLRLEKTIPLAGVQGRIDHLSLDVKGQRLFVAALGNNTVEVLDLKAARRVRSIPGLSEPQGVFYLAARDRLYVANGGDGSVRIFEAGSGQLLKSVSTSGDADNIRFDAARGRLFVGYGSGALAEFDPDGAKTADIALGSHPESFQLEQNGPRIFVNLPKSRSLAVVDRTAGKVIAKWSTGGPLSNFPMALDEAGRRLLVVCRSPARLVILDTGTGQVIQSLAAVGDCDDVFFDAARKRIYASGGEGAISVFQQNDAGQYGEAIRIPTVKGARTAYYSADLDRLYLAVRQEGSHGAEIRIYAPER